MYTENDRIFICGENRDVWCSKSWGDERMVLGRYTSSDNIFLSSN